jgi:hypothetical protein
MSSFKKFNVKNTTENREFMIRHFGNSLFFEYDDYYVCFEEATYSYKSKNFMLLKEYRKQKLKKSKKYEI